MDARCNEAKYILAAFTSGRMQMRENGYVNVDTNTYYGKTNRGRVVRVDVDIMQLNHLAPNKKSFSPIVSLPDGEYFGRGTARQITKDEVVAPLTTWQWFSETCGPTIGIAVGMFALGAATHAAVDYYHDHAGHVLDMPSQHEAIEDAAGFDAGHNAVGHHDIDAQQAVARHYQVKGDDGVTTYWHTRDDAMRKTFEPDYAPGALLTWYNKKWVENAVQGVTGGESSWLSQDYIDEAFAGIPKS